MTQRPPHIGGRTPSLDLAATATDLWRLKEHAGQWVVLAFYPHDFGRLCTRQLTGYASIRDDLAAANAVLAVVSYDDLVTHRRFTEELGFPFPLLADPDRAAAAAWGVTVPLHTAKRASFVIDPPALSVMRSCRARARPGVHRATCWLSSARRGS